MVLNLCLSLPSSFLRPFAFLRQFLNKRYAPKWPMPWQVPLVIFGILVSEQMNLHEEHELSVGLL